MAHQLALGLQVPLIAQEVPPIASVSSIVKQTTKTSQIPHIETTGLAPAADWLDTLVESASQDVPPAQHEHHCIHDRRKFIGEAYLERASQAISQVWRSLQTIISIGTEIKGGSSRKQPDYAFTYASNGSSIIGNKDGDELRKIPDYVLEYAPYCHLYSEEEYWPGLLQVHLDHTTPFINYKPVHDKYRNRNLDNLDELNGLGRMYLQSNDDPESYPDWLGGQDNIPSDNLASRRKHSRWLSTANDAHRSSAPATLIVVDKGDYLDAFWFFFYSFNLGNQVLGVRFGNHVGDWEHTAVRFSKKDGKPIEVFYSEHEWGAAYRWEDAEKHDEKRMLTYSAFGTHAMYHDSGVQRYVLPFGLLQDITDRGPLWDPTLNLYAYTYDPQRDIVRASTLTPDAPENWFHFSGHWGDKKYPMDDPRQYRFAGELHYDSGPTGPKFKNLGRSHICQNEDTCLKHIDLRHKGVPTVISYEMWQKIQRRKRLEN